MIERFVRIGPGWVCVVLVAVGWLGPSRSVTATEDELAKLPVRNPYQCATCHLQDNPLLDSTLNVFGIDFQANGLKWDGELARLDSDLDGCNNGVEIGDSDGNGVPDGNIVEQTGNPGVFGDCGSEALVDEKTWGTLKAMFDGG